MKFFVNGRGRSFCSLLSLLALLAIMVAGCADDDDATEVFVAQTFTVTASVSGLEGELVLRNNGGDDLTISEDGEYKFASILDNGDSYNVTIESEPSTSLSCNGTNASGVISGENVSDVHIACSTPTLRDIYPGAEACKECHRKEYNIWAQSGHGYKMNKVENETLPIYPFSDISAMFPDGSGGHEVVFDGNGPVVTHNPTLSNTSYIIGGYGWKARYINDQGSILHGSGAQYNFATESFSAYHNGASDEATVDYNCGFCHTTGWKSNSGGETAERTDGLAGMDGWFDNAAITCQRCHSTMANPFGEPGGHYPAHMQANEYQPDGYSAPLSLKDASMGFAALDNMSGSNNVCSDCHIRGDSRYVVPVKGGLIRHHEQSQEFYIGGHDGSCMTCHDPHASTKHDSMAKGEGVLSDRISDGNCSKSCHVNEKINPKYGSVHNCVDCHMPYVVKTALSFDATSGVHLAGKSVGGVTALGIPGGKRGDIRSHVFALSSNSNSEQFGSNLDGTNGQVKLAVDYTCMTCHGAGGAKGPTSGRGAEDMLETHNIHNW